MNTKQRKDPIIIDDSLIGREVYFRGKEALSYITPNKRYEVISIRDSGCLVIIGDTNTEIWLLINNFCAHLGRNGWLLAKRTSSSQSVVRTESGRKL